MYKHNQSGQIEISSITEEHFRCALLSKTKSQRCVPNSLFFLKLSNFISRRLHYIWPRAPSTLLQSWESVIESEFFSCDSIIDEPARPRHLVSVLILAPFYFHDDILSLASNEIFQQRDFFSLELTGLLGSSRSAEEELVSRFQLIFSHASSESRAGPLLFIPKIDEWWTHASQSLRTLLVCCLTELSSKFPPAPLNTDQQNFSSTVNHRDLVLLASCSVPWTSSNLYELEMHPRLFSIFQQPYFYHTS